MKTFIATIFMISSLGIYAQSDRPVKDTKAKPTPVAPSSTAQKQEVKPGIENTYPVGPYDKDGKYDFFSKQEQQQRSLDEEKAETE